MSAFRVEMSDWRNFRDSMTIQRWKERDVKSRGISSNRYYAKLLSTISTKMRRNRKGLRRQHAETRRKFRGGGRQQSYGEASEKYRELPDILPKKKEGETRDAKAGFTIHD